MSCLLLACAFLVADGFATQGDAEASSGFPGLAMESDEAVAIAIEQRLEELNPALTPRELHRISSAVVHYSREYGLDPSLVTGVIEVESGARPWAYSPKGAVGLMQVMPYMMEPLGLAGNAATIESNIEAGCWILSHNIRRLGEDRGILSYFWGTRIRGVAYLEKVREAQAEFLRLSPS